MKLTEKIKDLKWEPSVGDYYFDVPEEIRFLVVGDSHFIDGSPKSIDESELPSLTNDMIASAMEDYDVNRFYTNTVTLLCEHADINKDAFWNHLAFYNFIQRPMKKNGNKLERPGSNDIRIGNIVFNKLLNEPRPSIVLFLGLQISDSLPFMKKVNLNIGGLNPREGEVKLDNHEVKVFGVRHPSISANYEWHHKFIMQTELRKFIEWLTPKIVI